MRKIAYVIAILGALSCSKKTDLSPTSTSNSNENTVAKIEVTVLDTLNIPVEGAGVVGYTSKEIYESWYRPNFYVVHGYFTDKNGKLIFDGDSKKENFVRIEKDCMGNRYTTYQITQSLSTEFVNKVTIKLGTVGDVNVFNQTTDTYSMYIDNVFYQDVKTSSRFYANNLKGGDHMIKAVQKTNVIGIPTVKLIPFNLSCNKDKSLLLTD